MKVLALASALATMLVSAATASPRVTKSGFGPTARRHGDRPLHADQRPRGCRSRSSRSAAPSRRSSCPTAAAGRQRHARLRRHRRLRRPPTRTSAASPAATPTASRAASFTLDGDDVPAGRSTTSRTACTAASTGFDKRVWTREPFTDRKAAGVRSLHQPGRRGGLPRHARRSTVDLHARRRQRAADRLRGHDRQADRRQPHQPRLLEPRRRGQRQRSYDHELKLNASRYTPVDATLIPTGELAPRRAARRFDFRASDAIGERIRDDHPQLAIGRGYDHNWVLDRHGRAELVGRALRDPASGRHGDLDDGARDRSSTPATSSTARWSARGGRVYRQGDGLALETQHFPDSPNQPSFPSTVLRPGQTFTSSSIYAFSTSARAVT